MKNINAIILTYDQNRIFTKNMIKSYENIWPDHPFTFHVPYQNLKKINVNSKVVFHKSRPDIHSTINTLLSKFDNNEMIYWCIDDKYPIKLNIKKIKKILDLIKKKNYEDFDGLIYCRCRNLNYSHNVIKSNQSFIENIEILERKNYRQIWIHQFLKIKVLKFLFSKFDELKFPYKDNPISMDFMKDRIKKPSFHKLMVTKNNYGIFGESAIEGKMTINCKESLLNKNIKIPNEINCIDKRVYMGGFKILNKFFLLNSFFFNLYIKYKLIYNYFKALVRYSANKL